MLRKGIDPFATIDDARKLADLFEPDTAMDTATRIGLWAVADIDAAEVAVCDYVEPMVAFMAWHTLGRSCSAAAIWQAMEMWSHQAPIFIASR